MPRGVEWLVLAVCVAGCATNPTTNVSAFAERSANNSFELFDRSIETTALVLPVVHDQQTSGAACGAHALASVVNYWKGADTVTGDLLYTTSPPADTQRGYTMAELIRLARSQDLLANGVRLPQEGLVDELESGRPVLVPVRVPSIFVQSRTLPALNAPVIGFAANFFQQRVGRVSEWTDFTMVDHYLLVVGYEGDSFVVVEPVMGFRTMSSSRLQRYRDHFDNAAIVFSAPPRAPATAGAPSLPPG